MTTATPAPTATQSLGLMAWLPDTAQNWLYNDVMAYIANGRPAGHASFGLVHNDGVTLWTYQASLLTLFTVDGNKASVNGVGSLWDGTTGAFRPAEFQLRVEGLNVQVSILTGQGAMKQTFYSVSGTVGAPNLWITH